MTDSPAQPGKPYILKYYAAGWGGWMDLPYDTMVSDDPADFDTVEEGRKLARSAAVRNHAGTRIVNRATHEVVAEYRSDGTQVI